MFRRSVFNNRMLNLAIFIIGILYALIMGLLLFWRGHDPVYHYNLIPFQTIKLYIVNRAYFDLGTWISNLFGNIVMFIPLGIIIPTLNNRFLKILLFLTAIIAILLAVELLQMVMKVGSFDVDDVILNTIGAIIGFIFTKWLISKMR
jgi:glycopeptide antibiotics resistance protein